MENSIEALQKLKKKIELLENLAIHFLVYTKVSWDQDSRVYFHSHVYCIIIHKSQDMETT